MSNSQKAYIIGEAGVNHNGKMDYAHKLIDIAKEAGADSVKFQIINPWGLYLPGEYSYGHYDIEDVIKNRMSTVLTDQQYLTLKEYSDAKEIDFSGSVFDEKGLELLHSFNPQYIKIASCDLTNIRLLRQVAATGIRMILSTGMSTLKEIEYSINELAKVNFDNIVIMHCVSIYPCPPEKANVNMLEVYKKEFGLELGFSDHTRTNESAIAAYCIGARYFEKHFTFDNTLEGFDHKHAQNVEEFSSYVKSLRDIETSYYPQEEKIDSKEAYTAERARRSLYASRDLKKGEVLKDEDVLCVRPSNEMSPNQIDMLIGKTLEEDISQYAPFSLNNVK